MNPVPGQQPQRVSVKRSNVVATAAALPILAAVFFTIGWFVKPAETTKAPATTTEPTDKQDTETSAPDATDSAITTQATDSSVLPSTGADGTTTVPPSTTPQSTVTLPPTDPTQDVAGNFPLCKQADSLGCLFQQIRKFSDGGGAKLLGGFTDIEYFGKVPAAREFRLYVVDCGPELPSPDRQGPLHKYKYSAAVALARDAVEKLDGLDINVEGKCTVEAEDPKGSDLAVSIVDSKEKCAPEAPKSGIQPRNDPIVLSVSDLQFYLDGSDSNPTRCGATGASAETATSTTAANAATSEPSAFVPPTTQ